MMSSSTYLRILDFPILHVYHYRLAGGARASWQRGLHEVYNTIRFGALAS